jgi:hypothetical protein
LKFALPILNSKLIGWYHNTTSPKAQKGLFPKILVNDVRNIPIRKISEEKQQPLIEKADKMLLKNKELHELKTNFLNFLKSELKPAKISKKLENWQELDWEAFKKELKKSKTKDLDLQERKEWLSYFTEQKEKAVQIQKIIDRTDREIDRMVYELYGLTEEEIHVVEKN